MILEILKTTKTYEHNSKLCGNFLFSLTESDNSYRHYWWEEEIFGEARFKMRGFTEKQAENFMEKLAQRFKVPIPKCIFVSENRINYSFASSECLDGFIVFVNDAFSPNCVIHEFIHWLSWYKKGSYIIHNRKWVKALQLHLYKEYRYIWENI